MKHLLLVGLCTLAGLGVAETPAQAGGCGLGFNLRFQLFFPPNANPWYPPGAGANPCCYEGDGCGLYPSAPYSPYLAYGSFQPFIGSTSPPPPPGFMGVPPMLAAMPGTPAFNGYGYGGYGGYGYTPNYAPNYGYGAPPVQAQRPAAPQVQPAQPSSGTMQTGYNGYNGYSGFGYPNLYQPVNFGR